MTDNEIIKALECCTQQAGCSGCPFVISNEMKYRGGYACAEEIRKCALDLINRQKAEIERLKHRKTELQIRNQELQHEKSEAIKEFAERLKAYFNYGKDVMYLQTIIHYGIDKIIKEMEGEK